MPPSVRAIFERVRVPSNETQIVAFISSDIYDRICCNRYLFQFPFPPLVCFSTVIEVNRLPITDGKFSSKNCNVTSKYAVNANELSTCASKWSMLTQNVYHTWGRL